MKRVLPSEEEFSPIQNWVSEWRKKTPSTRGKKTMARSRKKTTNTVAVVAIVVALIALAAVFGVFSTGGEGIQPTDDEGNLLPLCSSEVTPDLDIDAFDSENPGTAVTEATNLYRKVGNTAWTTWTQGTAITNLEPYAEYEFVMGITTSDMTDNAYGEFFTHKIKCQESEVINKAVYNDEIETSLSATFYNSDNNAAAETFTAGQEKHVKIKLIAGSDEFFGNPTLDNAGVIVLKLNSSEWDTPNSVKVDGVEMKRVSVPQRYDGQAATYTEFAYELPAIGEDEVWIDLYLNADDSNAPSIDGTAYLYAGGYYITDDAEVAIGVEDEDGNAVGTDAPDTVTLDFTA